MWSWSVRMRRALVATLARRRGEVRAAQDLRQLGEVARLSGVFALTMLAPIAFLAFLSLTSIRSEELAFDADLRARGRSTTAQVHGDLSGFFSRFESAVRERIRRGESPMSALGELSPHLRAAFRFDDDGNLAAPFALPSNADAPEPSLGWLRAEAEARALEATDLAGALVAWRDARAGRLEAWALGESLLGEARVLERMGRAGEAEQILTRDVFGDYATDRDIRGFRFGDLARLELARMRAARGDDELARALLVDLVDLLLAQNAPWTIGEEGEAAIVRDALRQLEGQADADWLARSRSRLNELHAQLVWAESVRDEIELVYSRIPDGEFRYVGARMESPAVWALVRAGPNTYAFSFSVSALFDDLRMRVADRNALDKDLSVNLYYRPDQIVPDSSLSTRTLGPWLPGVTLSVEPKDPPALAATKNRRRNVRIAIVFTAVFVAVVGAFWIARIIAWEVETARQRADFAANVSHELRSPITQIRLKGEALQLGLVDPGDDMQRHFDAIVRESERLSRLVDNVLDFAAIERGVKSYHLRPDDLRGVVLASIEAARASLEEAGMELEVDLQDTLPPVLIDREAIGQVMTNLLSNALKYGADGKWVRVRLHGTGERIELSVADRGIGISAEEVPRVFDDFFRSADPSVRRTKGTGIGLAIVRYIVEAHGGTIRVDSERGRGARFVVHLPVDAPEQAGGERG